MPVIRKNTTSCLFFDGKLMINAFIVIGAGQFYMQFITERQEKYKTTAIRKFIINALFSL